MIQSDFDVKKTSLEKPLVSIIMAVYNGGNYTEQAISSVISQSYSNIEFIIIDGKSTDGTVDVIEKHSDKISYWISESDNGIYEAWNKGLKIAKGEWIAFIGSDDILYSDAIQNYVTYIQKNYSSEFEYISSEIELVTNDLKLKRIKGRAWKWNTFKKFMNTAHVGSLHSKKIFEKYGMYDINYKIAADYEMLLRSKEKLKAGFMDTITVKMRCDNTLSMKNSFETQKETFRAKIKTAGRNKVFAYYEMVVAILKANLRRLLNI